jgi:hypothetical protein
VERGGALEDLVEFVFSKIPSVKLYQRDVRDEDGAQEVDLIFSHYPAISRIPISDVTEGYSGGRVEVQADYS